MISKEEKTALVKMFCAYCRRTLRNAKTDLMREEARRSRKETLFSEKQANHPLSLGLCGRPRA